MNRSFRIIWIGVRLFWAFGLLVAAIGYLAAFYAHFAQGRVEDSLTIGVSSFLLSETMIGLFIVYVSRLSHSKPRSGYIDAARLLWVLSFFFPVVGFLGSVKGLPDVTGAGILLVWSAIPQYVAFLLVLYGKLSKRGSRSRYRG